MDCGHTCLPTEFQCKNGQCISATWVCDREADCQYYTDADGKVLADDSDEGLFFKIFYESIFILILAMQIQRFVQKCRVRRENSGVIITFALTMKKYATESTIVA